MPEQNRMKIAFVYDVIYPYVKGGVEKRVWELAVRLKKRGHEVHIFGMKYWDGEDILVRDGVILHGVCPAKPLYSQGRRTIGEAINFSIRLIPHIAQYRFDLIDCQQFPFFSCLSVKSLTLIKKTPLVITWHEVWGNYWYAYLGSWGAAGKYIELLVS
ncbi:MAG: glycosyltransferase family 4 protein, partial [Methanoregula sp.]|nr:glycosyltransferase family 4 protein [Methanoregula sp.]